ncbi:MAG: hypothetical protein A2Z25_16535 [Planctomycetes bacterium RBG_16_55_9]|nr:MAG: hypothetical protein A2Z25_16535 [Planctomycetes bacterium RBG_16_55_9]
MWLPKDERKLLSLYYNEIGKPSTNKLIDENDLIKTILPKWHTQHVHNSNDYKMWLEGKSKVATANKALSERKLITHREAGDSIEISLDVEGYDLGRKYDNWFDRSGLWFAEYKNHWIWLIASFFGGVLGGLLINLLSR